MNTVKRPSLGISIAPIFFLIIVLWFNVQEIFGDDALSGTNQMVLLLSAAFATLLGTLNGTSFEKIIESVRENIAETTKPIIILLLIGALSGTWLISGVIPAMVYYGLEVLNPTYFLFTTVIICALVSIATGSSWSTTATVGIALIAIGNAMGIDTAMVAGAIISGAYFGDKMSPLSDTTNLAPAMAGTDLFTHIRYMAYTTIPSIILTLIIFLVMGFSLDTTEIDSEKISLIQTAIEEKFSVSLFLFIVPATVVFLIIKKVDSLIALFVGVLLAALFALFFQPSIVMEIGGYDSYLYSSYKAILQSMSYDMTITTTNVTISSLLSSSGMAGMLNTIWLILAAMVFGGSMEATGFLSRITSALASVAKGTASLIFTTAATCGIVNISASDQYLAIVVPGRMFRNLYRERKLAPENLSRTLEDSGTVTSVLVPWNTCGAYQSGVLGVATGEYFIYAFFNLISPLMTMIFAIFSIRIAPLKEESK